MKILFCINGSQYSFQVIKQILPFLFPHYEITLINVANSENLDRAEPFSRNILNEAKKVFEDNGYQIARIEVLSGDPAKAILDFIAAEQYDLAILGSRSKKGIRNWLGSVSRKVVTKSPVPVLITKIAEEIKGSKRILIAADESDYSSNAIKTMLNLINLENSSVEVLTVMPGAESLPIEIRADKEWLEKSLARQKEITVEILEKSKKLLEENNIIPEKRLYLEGDPAEEILNYAAENQKDLIVMGSHGRGGFSEFLLGSVSKRVLDNSAGSVLIVPLKYV